jgi:hypothetical protein
VAVPQRTEHFVKEVSVFEIAQQSQINTQTYHDQQLALPEGFGTCHPSRQQEVAHGDNSQQEKINAAALVIEIIGKGGYKQQTCRGLFLQKYVYQAEPQKEEQEQSAAENHRLTGVVRKYICQFSPIELPHNDCMLL